MEIKKGRNAKPWGLFMLDGENTFRSLIGAFDGYTGEHSDKVTRLAVLIGEKLQMSPKELAMLRLQAKLHDIGKIGVPKSIVNKPGKLTPEEFEQMKKHTVYGANFLRKFGSDKLHGVHFGALYHHERWDGTGYPYRVAQKSIPLEARIISVCDAVEAMTSDRCYRKALPYNQVIDELMKGRGTQFDPEIVDIMLDVALDIIRENYMWDLKVS